MFSGLVTVSGMGSTTAREMSLRFLNRSFFLKFLHCRDILRFFTSVTFHPQGSVSVVVPDQMHWRGNADFPKVRLKLLGLLQMFNHF